MEIPLIRKNGTNNQSEERLYNMCLKTFLRMWCYPSPYGANRRELCDVLVVFGNHVILFSDKNEGDATGILSKNNKDEGVKWQRWLKRRIYKSVEQLRGGERYIRRNSTIYLDKKRSSLFPYKLPTQQEMIVHLVAVAGGVGDECRNYFPDNIGSFRYFNKLNSQHKNKRFMDEFNDEISQFDHFHRDIKRTDWLYIGNIEKEKHTQQREFIHVFTDESLELVLKELSTAEDFVEYLVARKRLFEECDVFATGEEHLLARYLTNINSDGVHDFLRMPKPCINVFNNTWNGYEQFRDSTLNTHTDKESYMWDTIIDNIEYYYVTQRFADVSIESEEVEHVLRIMASENRLTRKTIVNHFHGMANKLRTELKLDGYIVNIIHINRTMYVLLVTNRPENCTDDQYSHLKLKIIDDYCHSAQHTAQLVKKSVDNIIGFAIDSNLQFQTVSFYYLNAKYMEEHDEARTDYFDVRHLCYSYETSISE